MTENDANSHRLIYYAGTKGKAQQDALVEELFLNYFSEEKYIGDPSILLAAADKVCVRVGGGCVMRRRRSPQKSWAEMRCKEALWRRRSCCVPECLCPKDEKTRVLD